MGEIGRKQAFEIQQWWKKISSRTLRKHWGRSPFYRRTKYDRLGAKLSSPEFSTEAFWLPPA
jgi:hypothetical protein